MSHRLALSSWIVLLVIGMGGIASAEEPAENQELRTAYNEYATAFNRHDADEVGKFWAKDGSYVVTGAVNRRVDGREQIVAAFKDIFAKAPDVKLDIALHSVRAIKPDVCLTEGQAVVIDKGGVVFSTFNDVWTKEDGQWRLTTAHETILPTSDAKNEQLLELDWMVGAWTEQTDGLEVKTTCRWSLDGAFLTRNFSARRGNQVALHGYQVIGWDPVKKSIRSWTFDSDAGFSEGTWTRDGDRWTIAASGVLADGRRVTSQQIIERKDDDTLLFRQIGREAEGQLLPTVPTIEVRRQPAE